MKGLRIFFPVLMVFLQVPVSGQGLQPGFDASEYLDVLAITFGKYDSLKKAQGSPAVYRQIHVSPVVGLDNRWSLWLRNDGKQAVISVRGTVSSGASWLANVYAVMQPAAGSFRLNDSTVFNYKVSDDSTAAVHTGWLISLASLSSGIEQKIKESYDLGVKDIILVGHSQGAGINYLLRSYLYYRTREGALPQDIRYKTYCSAA